VAWGQVYSDIPVQVRAAHRIMMRRQNDDTNVITNIIGDFKTFDVSKDGYVSTNVIETALLWLGGCESKDKISIKEMILEGAHVPEGTDEKIQYEKYCRSRAAEISVGTMIIPNLKFGYIDYKYFIERMHTDKRSNYYKKGTLRNIMNEFHRKLRHEKDSLLARTVKD
jgi:hypothetical protein